MRIAEKEAARNGIAETCKALGLSRATYYRRQKKKPESAGRVSPRKLSSEEEREVLSYLTLSMQCSYDVPHSGEAQSSQGAS
jgi:hypothetical protein